MVGCVGWSFWRTTAVLGQRLERVDHATRRAVGFLGVVLVLGVVVLGVVGVGVVVLGVARHCTQSSLFLFLVYLLASLLAAAIVPFKTMV